MKGVDFQAIADGIGAMTCVVSVEKRENGGYGKIKGTTFRVSNMGDETPETMNELFAAMDKAIAQL